jgi:protein SCO1/2
VRAWPLHRLLGLAALALAVLLAGFVGVLALEQRMSAASAQSSPTWFTGTDWQPIPKLQMAADFSLPDQARRTVSLREFRGKVVLLTFTSSVCKQQCPIIAREVTATERMLGPQERQTVLLNVSVDPEADTRQTVRHFARTMGWLPYDWYYLWAPRRQMQHVWDGYYLYVPPPPPIYKPGVSVIHTAALVLIDQRGRVRAYLSPPFLPSGLARGVHDLLEGQA